MPRNAPDTDSNDDREWMKPTREKGANDRVPQSRDISKQIEKAQRRNANPSR